MTQAKAIGLPWVRYGEEPSRGVANLGQSATLVAWACGLAAWLPSPQRPNTVPCRPAVVPQVAGGWTLHPPSLIYK